MEAQEKQSNKIVSVLDSINLNQIQPKIITEFKQVQILEEEKVVTTDQIKENIRVAILGNVDAGKSTLTSILASPPGTVDDGRGAARSRVFNFKHEQNNGRTSSIAHEIMGFTAEGNQYVVKNKEHCLKKNKIWPEIVENSEKIVHLLDMCGHEKYFKTTLHGLTSLFPDYCLIIIGANMGISRMTKEHLGVAHALGLPIAIVFTKIDLAPQQVYKDNFQKLVNIVKVFCDRIPVNIKTFQDLQQSLVYSGKICPIFSVSSCSGVGIDLLRSFLRFIPQQQMCQKQINEDFQNSVKTKVIIDSTFFCKGIGLVLGGTVIKGDIKIDQQLMLGPTRQGTFIQVIIKDIHQNRVSILSAGPSSSITINVRPIGKNNALKQNHIRKGSILINPFLGKLKKEDPYHQVCCNYFDAEIRVLHNHTTIKVGYQGVVHVGGIRSTVKVTQFLDEKTNIMRTGDTGLVRFKFIAGVEVLEEGDQIMIREQKTQACGVIKKVHPYSPGQLL